MRNWPAAGAAVEAVARLDPSGRLAGPRARPGRFLLVGIFRNFSRIGIAVIRPTGSTLMRIFHRLGKELLKTARNDINRTSILASCAAIAIAGLAIPAG